MACHGPATSGAMSKPLSQTALAVTHLRRLTLLGVPLTLSPAVPLPAGPYSPIPDKSPVKAGKEEEEEREGDEEQGRAGATTSTVVGGGGGSKTVSVSRAAGLERQEWHRMASKRFLGTSGSPSTTSSTLMLGWCTCWCHAVSDQDARGRRRQGSGGRADAHPAAGRSGEPVGLLLASRRPTKVTYSPSL